MKILFIESAFAGGGSTESLYQHVKHLPDRLTPVVVMLKYNRRIMDFKKLSIRVHVLGYWFYNTNSLVVRAIHKLAPFLERLLSWNVKRKLRHIIFRENPDIIHTNNNPARDFYAISVVEKFRMRTPVVSHIRSFNTGFFMDRKGAFLNKRVSRFIAWSHSVRDFWIQEGIEADKIIVIPNGIDELDIQPANLVQAFGVPGNRKVIGMVGSIRPERGHKLMLLAMPKILEEMPNAVLLIVGSGKSGPLRKLAKQLKIERQVIFTGHQDKAHNIIASLDVLAMPYTIEPFGRVLLEAWQVGTPVVLPRLGYIEDIPFNKTALFRSRTILFTPQNSRSLAMSVLTALQSKADPDLNVWRVYHIIKTTKSICETYEEVLR